MAAACMCMALNGAYSILPSIAIKKMKPVVKAFIFVAVAGFIAYTGYKKPPVKKSQPAVLRPPGHTGRIKADVLPRSI
ncbi:MAG: hypothetical protein ACTHNW_05060 [Mucilaginibacter sp.]